VGACARPMLAILGDRQSGDSKQSFTLKLAVWYQYPLHQCHVGSPRRRVGPNKSCQYGCVMLSAGLSRAWDPDNCKIKRADQTIFVEADFAGEPCIPGVVSKAPIDASRADRYARTKRVLAQLSYLKPVPTFRRRLAIGVFRMADIPANAVDAEIAGGDRIGLVEVNWDEIPL